MTSPITGATAFPVGKPVNLTQLKAEIVTATGVASINLALTGGDALEPLSDDNPATLWVAPASLDSGVVNQVVEDHSPDSNWGVPSVILDFNEVWALLAANPEVDLTAEQQTKLLRGLAFRVLSPSQSAG